MYYILVHFFIIQKEIRNLYCMLYIGGDNMIIEDDELMFLMLVLF